MVLDLEEKPLCVPVRVSVVLKYQLIFIRTLLQCEGQVARLESALELQLVTWLLNVLILLQVIGVVGVAGVAVVGVAGVRLLGTLLQCSCCRILAFAAHLLRGIVVTALNLLFG